MWETGLHFKSNIDDTQENPLQYVKGNSQTKHLLSMSIPKKKLKYKKYIWHTSVRVGEISKSWYDVLNFQRRSTEIPTSPKNAFIQFDLT